jgi:predicted methyltransferase
VIEQAQKAGFRLAAKSEINANPKDTKDHPFGVWTLPPNLRSTAYGSDKAEDPSFDKSKYIAIGESDRMTLKFVKQ